MSEKPDIILEKKLSEERERLRLNAIKTLKFLGYQNDPSQLTQEQLDARVELLIEQKQNEKKDATQATKPLLFQGIDGERENVKATEKAQPSELDHSEYMEGYDALTALIPQLRPNSQIAHAIQFGAREDIRIMRVPVSIKLNEKEHIIRRVVL